jgi:hypothetical protein
VLLAAFSSVFRALQVAVRPPKNPNKPQTHVKVAQQYITNPLLIQGRKFHLRLWLLVTSHQPLRAYLHGQGLVLFSSEPYDTKRPLEGPGVRPSISHVTNYARWGCSCAFFLHVNGIFADVDATGMCQRVNTNITCRPS